MNSKAKGSAGERELCVWLTAHGYPARRNEQRYIGGKGNADVVAEGLERFHFEVKRGERLNVPAAMQQAERDRGWTYSCRRSQAEPRAMADYNASGRLDKRAVAVTTAQGKEGKSILPHWL